MKVVIITGGIGSGKSTVCTMLKNDYGWPVYNADGRVKELYAEDPTLLSDIETALGLELRDDKGVFVPSRLASRIFSDAHALQTVEGLVFPVLTDDFARWKADNADKEYLVLESATILEKPSLIGLGDYVTVVDAPLPVRVSRTAGRDGVSHDAVHSRVAMQKLMNAVSEGIVPECVNRVIHNDRDLESLSHQVRDLVKNIIET